MIEKRSKLWFFGLTMAFILFPILVLAGRHQLQSDWPAIVFIDLLFGFLSMCFGIVLNWPARPSPYWLRAFRYRFYLLNPAKLENLRSFFTSQSFRRSERSDLPPFENFDTESFEKDITNQIDEDGKIPATMVVRIFSRPTKNEDRQVGVEAVLIRMGSANRGFRFLNVGGSPHSEFILRDIDKYIGENGLTYSEWLEVGFGDN